MAIQAGTVLLQSIAVRCRLLQFFVLCILEKTDLDIDLDIDIDIDIDKIDLLTDLYICTCKCMGTYRYT